MAKRVPDSDKYKTIEGVPHKFCSTCKTFQPVGEYSKRNASADGLAYSCKNCERATAQQSYKKKKARKNAAQRYQENAEVYKERAKQRYADDPQAALAYQKEWRQTPKGKEVVKQASARRIERIRVQTPGGRNYTKQEVIAKDSIDGVCMCKICNKPITDLQELQIDHILPIKAGGADVIENVRCTHAGCNLTRPKDGSDL